MHILALVFTKEGESIERLMDLVEEDLYWDYWRPAGRFDDFLRVKVTSGVWVSTTSAMVKDVDWETTFSEQISKEHYDYCSKLYEAAAHNAPFDLEQPAEHCYATYEKAQEYINKKKSKEEFISHYSRYREAVPIISSYAGAEEIDCTDVNLFIHHVRRLGIYDEMRVTVIDYHI